MAFDEVLQATSHFGLTEVPKPLPQLVHLSQLAARELLRNFASFIKKSTEKVRQNATIQLFKSFTDLDNLGFSS